MNPELTVEEKLDALMALYSVLEETAATLAMLKVCELRGYKLPPEGLKMAEAILTKFSTSVLTMDEVLRGVDGTRSN